MITPVYFPFTYISEQTISAFSRYFPKVAVYQPASGIIPEDMKQLAQNSMIDIRLPVSGDDDMIGSICKQFREWRAIHEGTEIQFLKTQADTIPFFDDSHVMRISSDIREKMASEQKESRDGQPFDPVLRSRIFLKLTQEYDTANTELNQNLTRYDAMEKALFADLKGEDEHLFSHSVEKNDSISDDYGNYMTEARIAAWTMLMQHDPAMPNLFITNSRAVLAFLLDRSPDAKKVLETCPEPPAEEKDNSIYRSHEELMPYINTLAEKGVPEQADRVACFQVKSNILCSLDFYLIPEESPYRFFSRFMKIKPPENGKTDVTHTVIGHIDINS